VIEIRFHGRGGQGAVVASKILAEAFFREGRYVQSFPAFGAERRGAPVAAFTRVDGVPIRLRTYIYAPDHVVVLDPSLLDTTDITAGLKPGGWVVINTECKPEEVAGVKNFRVATVDAGRVAVKHGLGTATAPIVNTAIIGAFARATGEVSIESVCEAIMEALPRGGKENAAACKEAYETTLVGGAEADRDERGEQTCR
jgi:2-oxoacid:acceptor oxidoreductase gamma subunit (pyruvate/2-ketoisovalerate family)